MNESFENILFTPAALLDFLSSIDELSDLDIGITETMNGNLQVQIGSSNYEIDTSSATNLQVDEHTVDQIDDINQTAYEELSEDYGEEAFQEEVEGGIIKEALKTLLIGGLVRLGAKALR